MKLDLNRKTQKLIEDKVRDGQYGRAEDVVQAAIGSLIAQENFGDFRPGELNRLLAEGERSIREHGTLDGETALRHRQRERSRRSRKTK